MEYRTRNNGVRIFFINWILVAGWAGLIFYLSSLPNLDSGLDQDFILRKCAHIFEYFVLTLLLYRAIIQKVNKKTAILIAVLVSLLYAVSDEYHQTFVFGRSGDSVDVLIDSVGIFISVFFVKVIQNKNGLILWPNLS